MGDQNLSRWGVEVFDCYTHLLDHEQGVVCEVTDGRWYEPDDGGEAFYVSQHHAEMAAGLVNLIDTALAILNRDSIAAQRTDLRAALVDVIGEQQVGRVLDDGKGPF